ncbi:MAG: hypothetical protein SD837_09955 [Candidatus Electrothrix scaldis]|nr:MAG: hypothetical protein SD837_09955 [Candidatus Electrothrix sp. GW3-3]
MKRPSLHGIFVVLICLFSLLTASPARAHKLNIFSWAEGDQIYGEAFFSGGRKAKNITIQVQNAQSDTVLLSVETDREGKFQFPPPQKAIEQKADLRIIANSGDGHRGEWLLTADEYLLPDASTNSPVVEANQGTLDVKTVREIVRQELTRELTPIKQQLAEAREKKVRPRDIVGGIGCIIGLAALFAWIQSNKKKKKNSTAE